MHELAITGTVVSTITQRMGAAKVRRIRLEVGKLSGLVPDAVRFCFEMIAAGTTCEDAELEIDEPTGRAHCRACGADFTTAEVLPLCDCGSADVAVTGGTDLRIVEVEVDRACALPADAPTGQACG
ncbi:hydrogenase maturation nickel metallochaperone HypA/HybF [Pseudonocardia sp. TRM90224]|uniref:hydrogenase maturation nickel metallochaperone HypA/HybF n=1 Tax=Pseudonocardia sp. TRM90224 TaxID=2812678 RepID=UPI001E429C4E|nr:hydrogenase maturation nickel metallochaperone HypA [Pseudonocardia sp. TRM90224]